MPQAIELPDDLTGLAAIQAHTVDDRGLRRSVSALIEVIEAGRNSLTAATVAETSPACNPNGGTIRTNPIDGMNYVYIPPGHFTMGCSPGDTDAADSEKPPHEVTISKGFWIAQTPVTVRAWKKFREATGAAHIPHGDDNIPVTSVTWDEACAYAVWARLSLATEAQWEYAARAGTTSPRFHYLDEIAWHKDNSGGRPHPVAKKKPNAWGLYDMLGNVSEWTADWFDERYYARSEAVDPVGPPTGEYRVLRGASCRGDAGGLRASFRAYSLPTTRYDIIGFRCVGE